MPLPSFVIEFVASSAAAGGDGGLSITITPKDLLIAGAVVASGLMGFWRGSAPARKLLATFGEFVDDWRGQPARDGVPERPGMMRRMATNEAAMGEVKAALVQHIESHNRESALATATANVIEEQARKGVTPWTG